MAVSGGVAGWPLPFHDRPEGRACQELHGWDAAALGGTLAGGAASRYPAPITAMDLRRRLSPLPATLKET
jgi:hypothetical protein